MAKAAARTKKPNEFIDPFTGSGSLVVHQNCALFVVAELFPVIYSKCKTPRGQARRFVPHAGGDSGTRYPLF